MFYSGTKPESAHFSAMTDHGDDAAPCATINRDTASTKQETGASYASDGSHKVSSAIPDRKMSAKRPRPASPRQHDESKPAAAIAVKSESGAGTNKSLQYPEPLPHGTFTGKTFHRNSLNSLETLALGHVTLHDLIPHNSTHCFATSFVTVHASWLEHTFGRRVDKFLLVRNDKRSVKDGQVKVGRGVLEPIGIAKDEAKSRKYQRAVVQPANEATLPVEGSEKSSLSGKGVKMEVGEEGDMDSGTNKKIKVDPSSARSPSLKDDINSDTDDEVEVLGTKRTIPNWHRIAARPATGGSLHSKLLLFRTAQGLRVVVTGSNLCPQWRADRDCLWVQDFDAVIKKRPSEDVIGSIPRFEKVLRFFVKDIAKCHSSSDDQYVRNFTAALFDGIDFSTAKAELVYSFPRSKNEDDFDKLAGGYPMLAKCVERLRSRDEYLTPDTDDENDCYSDPNDPSDKYSGLNVVYATAGSFGDVSPAFLRQMYHVMESGNIPHVSKEEPSWEEVPSAMKCLWPSTVTAQSMLPSGVINSLRNIPMKYWETIPSEARRRIFHDATPNTPSSGFGINERKCHPVVHGKIIYATPRRANGPGFPSAAYIGSHNFSRAAWGEGTKGPRNIEFGVVLATNERETRMGWEQRFPCTVIPHNAIRPPNDPYLPASAHKGIRLEWNMGNPKRAEERLLEYLQRDYAGDDEEMDGLVHVHDGDVNGDDNGCSEGNNSSTSPRDVIDLCGDSEEQKVVIDLYDSD